MTQLQAINNIIDTFSPLCRAIFISDWLEDINWHKENRLFVEALPKDWTNKWEILHELSMARNEAHHSLQHRIHLKESGYFSDEAKKAIENINVDGSVYFKGHRIDSENLYDYERTQKMYQALNYIYGWGLDASIPEHEGQKMVDFLMELVNKKSDRVN